MNYQARHDANKGILVKIASELNILDQKKSQLIESATRISGEQHLLDELMKEEKNGQEMPRQQDSQ